MFKEEKEILEKNIHDEESKLKVTKCEMVKFDDKLVNSDEKGGKKIVKQKTDENENDEEDIHSRQYIHSQFRGGRGGRGRGGNAVYCQYQ